MAMKEKKNLCKGNVYYSLFRIQISKQNTELTADKLKVMQIPVAERPSMFFG